MKKKHIKNNITPYNRTSLFKEIFLSEWKTLFLEGILLMISFLPSLLLLFFKEYYISSLYVALEAGNISNDEVIANSQYARLIFNTIASLCLVFPSIFVSGFTKVNHLLSTGESISFKLDFNEGVKSNLKVNMIYTLFFSILLALALFVKAFIVSGIGSTIFLGIIIAVFLPILLMIYYSNNVYTWKFKDYFHNNLMIYIRYFFKIFPMCLILASISLIFVFNIGNSFLWRYIVIILLLVFYQSASRYFTS